jgi:hypothetical protein
MTPAVAADIPVTVGTALKRREALECVTTMNLVARLSEIAADEDAE